MSVAQISRQGTVRSFGQSDIEKVADLSWRMLNQEGGAAPAGLCSYFEELYFHNPWRDDSLPSLVYEDANGDLIGFLGVIPRRMTLGQKTVRVACGSTLVVEPAKRSTLAGLCLLQAFLAGDQDLSLGDSANDITRRVWTGVGGKTGLLYSLSWSRPLRPAAYGLRMISRLKAGKPPKLLALAAKPICKVADYAAARIPGPFKNSDCGLLEEELDAPTLLGCLSTLSDGQRLRGQYDRASLGWLLGFMGTTRGHGDLRKRLLRDAEGSVIGWYVYFVKRGGIAEVAQIGACRNHMGQVLDHLFWDAWKLGALAVHGQLDPTHAEVLRERCCFFYRRGSWLLFHSRDRELQECILSGNAFLSRLDGEWCMGFPLNEN